MYAITGSILNHNTSDMDGIDGIDGTSHTDSTLQHNSPITGSVGQQEQIKQDQEVEAVLSPVSQASQHTGMHSTPLNVGLSQDYRISQTINHVTENTPTFLSPTETDTS